jgi:CRISPR system Cascade subunit CasE
MTLFLSRLLLDPKSRRTRSEFDQPYELHRTLARGFTDLASARVLFRADRDDPSRPFVLVQSHLPPDWDSAQNHLSHMIGHEVTPVELRWLTSGMRCRFRLQCRPSKRLPSGGAKRPDGTPRDGPRVVLKEPDGLFAWLGRQGDQHGFAVEEASFDRVYWLDSRAESRGRSDGVSKAQTAVPLRMKMQDEPLLGAVRFDGVLLVTDADKLREAIANGIGQQKAFGFGLLSVAPVR